MPRKLGQHFLKDKGALKKIVAALEISPRDVIVEIGSGHGELTRELVNKFISLKVGKFRIIAIEKDPRLASQLRTSEIGKFIEVIEGDVLRELEPITYQLTAKRNLSTYKLVGNIPYYLTGYLFRKISELAHSTDAQGKSRMPKLVVFTIQKEVAERICAVPPKMNLLAASIQFWGKPKIVERISKRSFRPAPKVDSAVIKITPVPFFPPWREKGDREQKKKRGVTPGRYYEFIKTLFKQPRKTVLNNLREGLKLPQKEIENRLYKLKIPPSARPANLSMSDINKLAVIFSNKRV